MVLCGRRRRRSSKVCAVGIMNKHAPFMSGLLRIRSATQKPAAVALATSRRCWRPRIWGKCADLNALCVGLCRAVGIPARDVYGVRVATSQLGFKSLGKSGDITKAQHCRAEVYLEGYGWVPVDPGDVRKVVLEEQPGLTLHDDVVKRARAFLFGNWEMNWMAYNYAHDLLLPKATRGKIGYFMYPQCETAEGRLDSLDPENFRYTMTSRELGTT